MSSRRSKRYECRGLVAALFALSVFPIPAGAQRSERGAGIQCGGWGSASVVIEVGDSNANSGSITVGTAENSGRQDPDWHSVEVRSGGKVLLRCATSVGSTRVETGSHTGLWIGIRASAPLEVAVRTRRGGELARMTYTPGAADTTLAWPARS